MGKMFLVTVDAHSKWVEWVEAHIVETPNSAGTIQKLRQLFATHGIPQTIVTNNGSVFTKYLIDMNGIKHLRNYDTIPPSIEWIS